MQWRKGKAPVCRGLTANQKYNLTETPPRMSIYSEKKTTVETSYLNLSDSKELEIQSQRSVLVASSNAERILPLFVRWMNISFEIKSVWIASHGKYVHAMDLATQSFYGAAKHIHLYTRTGSTRTHNAQFECDMYKKELLAIRMAFCMPWISTKIQQQHGQQRKFFFSGHRML